MPSRSTATEAPGRAELAAWDEPALGKLLEELRAEDALDGVGYTDEDIDELRSDPLRVLKGGKKACPGSRIAATKLESAVIERIADIGREPSLLGETLAAARREIEARRRELEGDVRRTQRLSEERSS